MKSQKYACIVGLYNLAYIGFYNVFPIYFLSGFNLKQLPKEIFNEKVRLPIELSAYALGLIALKAGSLCLLDIIEIFSYSISAYKLIQ